MLAETVSKTLLISLSLASYLLEQQTDGNRKTMSGTELCLALLPLSYSPSRRVLLCPTVYCNKPNDCKLMPKLVEIQTAEQQQSKTISSACCPCRSCATPGGNE